MNEQGANSAAKIKESKLILPVGIEISEFQLQQRLETLQVSCLTDSRKANSVVGRLQQDEDLNLTILSCGVE